MKSTVFSGVQPSGALTIGNYIGAIRNFSTLQDAYDTYYCVVDLHAITLRQVPKDLRANTKKVLALYLASGLDPEKSTVFIQSHVPAHTELGWVLNCFTYMGELSRMTQYKDKAKSHADNLNAGLFTYPVLMAADILLYQAKYVPVGEDQRQHLELARNIAERFNAVYSETFVVPEGLIPKETGRIMSLKDPSMKMSKSDPDQNGVIYILDDKDTIARKIRRSVTDSLATFRYTDEQAGLKNLIHIYQAFSDESIEDIVGRYENATYSAFKDDLADLIDAKLAPVRERYEALIADTKYLEKVYTEGAEKASYVARKTLSKVYRKVGFIR